MPDAPVAEPVTAEAPSDAPVEFVPSTEPIYTPPTDDAPPETEAPPTEEPPATPNYEELLASLTPEALAELAPVKDLVARRGESVRRTTEREQAAATFQAQQQYAGSEAVITDLADVAREAANNLDEHGNPSIPREKVATAATGLTTRGVSLATNTLSRYLEETTPDGFSLTKDESDAINDALVVYHTRPLDPSPVIRAWMKPWARAQEGNIRDQIRAELTPQIRREEQERVRVAQTAAAEGARPTTTPTALNGAATSHATAPADLTSFLGISKAIQAGQITDDEAQKHYAKLNR